MCTLPGLTGADSPPGLVRWSQGSATEEDISTIYVQLGNDFNTAKAAFERAGIDMA